jgi:predicted Zn-dependent protease
MVKARNRTEDALTITFVADELIDEHLRWARSPVRQAAESVMSLADVQVEFVGDNTDTSSAITALEAGAWDEERDQVNCNRLFERINLSTGQRMIVLSGFDLYTQQTAFVFGSTGITKSNEAGLTIISAHRLLSLPDQQQPRALRHIAKHEIGHLMGLGLAEGSIRNRDPRVGFYAGHCINECVMMQAASLDEALNQAEEASNRVNHGFCDDCTEVTETLVSNAIDKQ